MGIHASLQIFVVTRRRDGNWSTCWEARFIFCVRGCEIPEWRTWEKLHNWSILQWNGSSFFSFSCILSFFSPHAFHLFSSRTIMKKPSQIQAETTACVAWLLPIHISSALRMVCHPPFSLPLLFFGACFSSENCLLLFPLLSRIILAYRAFQSFFRYSRSPSFWLSRSQFCRLSSFSPIRCDWILGNFEASDFCFTAAWILDRTNHGLTRALFSSGSSFSLFHGFSLRLNYCLTHGKFSKQ